MRPLYRKCSKKGLLRLWLAARDFENGSEVLRRGMNTQS